MDLRNWECSHLLNNLATDKVVSSDNQARDDSKTTDITKVLGLIWNKVDDTLTCDIPELSVPGELNTKGVAKYSDFGPINGYISESVQARR